MDSKKAYEDVQLIKEMLSKTKSRIRGSGKYFILWGYVVLAGILGTYLLSQWERLGWIWALWFSVMLTGSIVTVFFARSEKERSRVVTLFDRIGAYLGMGFGISFFLATFAFPLLGIYDFSAIGPVTGMLAGTFLFILACVYEWKTLFAAALVWWLFSIGTAFLPHQGRAMAMIIPLILGYIIPGHILQRHESKEIEDEH